MNAQEQRDLFWKYFDSHLVENGSPFYISHEKGGKNQAAGNINNPSPMAMQTICCEYKYRENVVLVQFYINHNIPLYDYLHSNKKSVEKELGFHVEWVNCGKRSTSVRRIQKVFPIRENLKDVVEEVYPYILLFIKVFSKYL